MKALPTYIIFILQIDISSSVTFLISSVNKEASFLRFCLETANITKYEIIWEEHRIHK